MYATVDEKFGSPLGTSEGWNSKNRGVWPSMNCPSRLLTSPDDDLQWSQLHVVFCYCFFPQKLMTLLPDFGSWRYTAWNCGGTWALLSEDSQDVPSCNYTTGPCPAPRLHEVRESLLRTPRGVVSLSYLPVLGHSPANTWLEDEFPISNRSCKLLRSWVAQRHILDSNWEVAGSSM